MSAATTAVLSVLMMLNVYLKVRHSATLPRFDLQDETGYYKVESAFQYRYARLVADGLPIPELDVDAQYPEGIRVGRELTMWMEYATGWSYRLWPFESRPRFSWFVILWVSAVSSISLAAFYFLALRLTSDPILSLAGTALYGLSWAAISDLIGTYGFQCFALPLIFTAAAFLAAALDPEEKRPLLKSCLAGAALFAALAGWHVTRFILASLFIAAATAAWRQRGSALALRRLRGALVVVLAFSVLAGLALPSLRETRLLLSPTLCLGYGLLAALTLKPRNAAAFLAVLAAAFWGFDQLAPESSSYGHAYAMLFEKIRFGLAKPADPTLLNWEARMLWVGPFNSPESAFLIFTLLPLCAIAVPRLMSLGRADPSSRRGTTDCMVDALTALYLAGTILVGRLMPVFAFFLCLWGLRGLAAGAARSAAFVLILALLEGFKSFVPYSLYNPFMLLSAPLVESSRQPPLSFQNEKKLLNWLKANAGQGKPVLAHYGISGPILAYTSSPVLLNPKGESLSSRRKSHDYLQALYSDEAVFAQFCSRNGARFYVHNVGNVLDQTKDSSLYDSGRTSLKAGQAAVLFHLYPERLRHFRLVFENPDYRVFAVKDGSSVHPTLKPAHAVYDPAQYRIQTLPGGELRLDIPGVLERIRSSHQKIFTARLLARLGQRERALAAYEAAFAAWPPEPETHREAESLLGGR